MKLKNMIKTLTSPTLYNVELRNIYNEEFLFCKTSSPALRPYMDMTVWRWVPHGGLGNADFIVILDTEEENHDSE